MEKTSPERRGKIFDDKIPDKDGNYTLDLTAISRQFYLGALGKHFKDQPFRYQSRYGLSNEELRRYGGIDAHPIGHQALLSRHYLDAVIEDRYKGEFTEEQIALARFTALFHEVGESTHPSLKKVGLHPIGDIPHGEKTAALREEEAKIRHYIFSTDPAFADIDLLFIQRVERLIGHEPSEEDEKLHELIETAHTLQGFDAAMTMRFTHGHHHEFHGETHPETRNTLRRMATKIGLDTLGALKGHVSPRLYQKAWGLYILPSHFVDESNERFHTLCAPPAIIRRHIGHRAWSQRPTRTK